MDVIKITPEELREVAQLIKKECRGWVEGHAHAVDSDDREWCRKKFEKHHAHRMKLVKLADKLEADNLEALAFCAPAKGVQA